MKIKAPDTRLHLSEWAVDNLTLEDAVKELAALSKREDPKGKGCNIVLNHPEKKPSRLTLRLHDFTVHDALRHLASATGSGFKQVDGDTYIITPNE
jgi:hypothetical protein